MVTQVSIGRAQSGNCREAWLAPAAAASLRRVDRALGRTLPVTWAGRTWHEQNKLWIKYGRNPAKASPPGSSLHEKGMSIDTDDRPYTVLLDHGWKRTVKNEDWHFTYSTRRDNHLHDPTPAGGGSALTLSQEDDMPIIIAQRSNSALAKGLWNRDTGRIREITRHENTLLRAAQGENAEQILYATVPDATYTALLKGQK